MIEPGLSLCTRLLTCLWTFCLPLKGRVLREMRCEGVREAAQEDGQPMLRTWGIKVILTLYLFFTLALSSISILSHFTHIYIYTIYHPSLLPPFSSLLR